MDESQLTAKLAAIESNVNNNTAAIMALTAAFASLPEASTIAPDGAYDILRGLLAGQRSLVQLEAPARAILENLLANACQANQH
jgi:hypothetical protein